MGRRKKARCVQRLPEVTFYKPQGIPMQRLQGVVLTVDGLEAMKLVDAEGLSQEEAASRMGISRPTLCRMLAEARSSVAVALSSGKAIRIEGGDFSLAGDTGEPMQQASEPCGPGRKRCGRKR